MLTLLLACTGPTPPSDSPQNDRCEGSLPEGTVDVFADGFVDPIGTEGTTFGPGGELFVGGVGADASIWELSLDGTPTRLAEVPDSIGLAWWNDRLLVAVSDTGDGHPGLVAVDLGGHTEVFASGLPGANFPAVTPWGTLLLSSPSGTTLWQVQPDGSWDVWVEDVPSPNGIAFSPAGDRVYVANTYRAPSTVASIAVSEGTAGEVEVLATLPDGSTQDGVAMDVDGNLYVVNNLPGTIVRITPEGETTVVAEGVEYGASLAFGEGRFDPCSVYVTSLFSEVVFRVGMGIPGRPPER